MKRSLICRPKYLEIDIVATENWNVEYSEDEDKEGEECTRGRSRRKINK